jgi:hypothetical protein
VRPGCAEITSPDCDRLGMILHKNALADDRRTELSLKRLQYLRRGLHAARTK